MTTADSTVFTAGERPGVAEAVEVFVRSGLDTAATQPERMALLLATSDVLVCARDGGRLVGLARGLTDFLYSCYLSDVVVDAAYQGRGIGRELVGRVREAVGPDVTVHLFAAPHARAFYERLGAELADDCFRLPPG